MSDAKSGIGIPIKLIHESEKHNIGVLSNKFIGSNEKWRFY